MSPPRAHLDFLRAAQPDVLRYEPFALLRGAEARARDLPRLGRSRLPAQNLVDLAQTPALAFAASSLSGIEVGEGRAQVSGYYFGLTGPMGPLPLHLTEFAFYEAKYARSRPFGGFLDLLSGRSLQLFYRAWADTQPAAQADRPDDDRFAGYVFALTGAGEGAQSDSAFPRQGRLAYASLFASRRSAAALEDGLTHLLGARVEVREFQPRWREIEAEDRTRLGGASRFNGLGVDAVIGSRVRTVSDAFDVRVRAESFRDYEDFLPTGRGFKIAADALDAFAPSHLEWKLELEIASRDARPVRLDGRGRLGWTAWLGSRPGAALRADARLGAGARRLVAAG